MKTITKVPVIKTSLKLVHTMLSFCLTYLWAWDTALQITAGQRSIITNLRPLTAHIYHVMIIMTDWFSKKYFWTILNLLSWNLNTFTKLIEQFCFLFVGSFFTRCFVIVLCTLLLCTFLYFSTARKHTGWVCFLFTRCLY